MNYPKLDIGLYANAEEMKRNYIGSEIKDHSAVILFDKNGELLKLIEVWKKESLYGSNVDEYLRMLVDKFIYEFESYSTLHNRSDSYQAYYFYNIALHIAIQLQAFTRDNISFNFLPKNFAARLISRREENMFRDLNATLYLPEQNNKKRALLNIFYEAFGKLDCYSIEEKKDIIDFLEFIYKRDFIWNFRDISTFNQKIKKGIIYRCSSLTRYQNEVFFKTFINAHNINRVIDLREFDELSLNPYSSNVLEHIDHIHAPIDPRKQSDEFRKKYHFGTNQQIAYRHFAAECKDQVRTIFRSLVDFEQKAVLIHCHAGKDRTGAIVSLIHLLSGADMDTVLKDYLASEMDAKPENLNAFLGVIEDEGGPEQYFLNCGLDNNEIIKIKNYLLRNE